MQVAELLAKNTVEQMKSGKQSRHPFQELPVLPEDYGKESAGGDVHKEIVEESQLIDEGFLFPFMSIQGCARFAEILVSARYCEVCAR